MILFCDTSALVKLYIREAGSDEVRQVADAAETVAVSRLAWVEMHSALARLGRESAEARAVQDGVKAQLSREWPNYAVVEPIPAVVEVAADYTDAFSLRAYDAVQLASASRVRDRTGQTTGFACFDRRLNQAARILGLRVEMPA